MTRPLSVLLAGGGSAGHVSPLLALADWMRRRDEDARVAALGTEEGLEAQLVPARGYRLLTVPRVPMPRGLSADLVALPSRLAAAVGAAGQAIEQCQADVVVGFGGYVSTPAYLAARRRGVPIVVHEQNARAGLANRLGARLTPHVGVTFPGTRLPHARVVGMPLRLEITTLDRVASRARARESFGLDPHAPTLFTFGGSLGAQRLNTVVPQVWPDLAAAGVQVLHMTGRGKAVQVPAPPSGASARYVAVEYIEQMHLAYAAADLALCRSGASTVCEVTAVGLPAVYVPLPVGNGEQALNAGPVCAAGGGLLVDDAALTPDWLRENLLPLLADPVRLAAMGRAAGDAGHRDGDERLGGLLLAAARGAS